MYISLNSVIVNNNIALDTGSIAYHGAMENKLFILNKKWYKKHLKLIINEYDIEQQAFYTFTIYIWMILYEF